MAYLRKLTLLAIVLALWVGSPVAALAQGGETDSESVFVPLISAHGAEAIATVDSGNISAAEEAAVRAFWTRERLASAQPLTAMADAGSAEVDAEAPVEAEALGAPGFAPSGKAAADADAVAAAAFAEDWALGSLQMDEAELEAGLAAESAGLADVPGAVDGTSQIYTSYIANWLSTDQTIYPHRWVGRLSFTTPDGTSYCSATSISNNHIVTAAHCVYDTPTRNQWYSNFVFTPAYRNGSAPYGTFPAYSCRVLTAWINRSGNYSIDSWARYDVAVCDTQTNSAGQTLNYAVGWAGRAWDYGYNRHLYNIGYPFRNYADNLLSWSGAYLRLCSAESFQRATDVRGMGCSHSRGNSGGPWIDQTSLASPTSYGTNGYWPGRTTGYVTGVYSGFFIGTQNAYAPRFTSSNIVPICNAEGC